MGLPKTGTSSVAEAVERLGFNMHHYAPSVAPLAWLGCDGLANAAEHEYASLHATYPCATWIVTHSANVSAWGASLKRQITKNLHANSKAWRCPAIERIFGNHTDVTQALAHASHGALAPPIGCRFEHAFFAAFYAEYYRRLFAFFDARRVTYRVVDVRKGDNSWRALGPIRGRCPVAPDAPFPMANSRAAKTSDYIGRCRDPRAWSAEWWLGLRPPPTRPPAAAEQWVTC